MEINLNDELERIKDVNIRNLTSDVLKIAPPHFWYRPASSTGKYHDPKENEVGGLVLHTKRVFRCGEILIEAWQPPFPDIIKSACTLHDICKYGIGSSPTQYTLSTHPQLAADLILKSTKDYCQDTVNTIADAVRCHMGRWGPSTPISDEAKIVHLADYIATKVFEESHG